MKLGAQVEKAFKDVLAGDFEAGLLHATIAIDATAKKLFPAETRVGERYKRCLRGYMWLVEPMIGAGLNLVDTRFNNLRLKNNASPDFADIVYEVFRCGGCHGDELASEFAVTISGGQHSTWELRRGSVRMPDRVVWSLLAVAVLAQVNGGELSSSDFYLTLGPHGPFLVREWWGREAEFRPFANAVSASSPRVLLADLSGFGEE